MRPPDFSPRRLPAEWLKAITETAGPERAFPDSKRQIQRTVTSLDDRPDGDDHDHGHGHDHDPVAEVRSLLRLLKRHRLRRGLSLHEVALLTRQARSVISRLESGEYANPTFRTLSRYARALGCRIRLTAEPIDDARDADGTRHDPARS